jgi:hypothetical protein
MDRFGSKEESDLYFERVADQLEAIAQAVRALKVSDREPAARLATFADQIRADSGLAGSKGAKLPERSKRSPCRLPGAHASGAE